MTTTHIEEAFRHRFRAGDGLELPRLSVLGRTSGILNNGHWHVMFQWGKSDQDEYLDYSAYCRFLGHEHVRIHQNGILEDLPAELELCPVGKREEFESHNRHVRQQLEDKGLTEQNIKYGTKVVGVAGNASDGLESIEDESIVIGDSLVLFWKPPAVFSQWSRAYFEINDTLYNCAEQFMMAEKAKLFGDDETLQRIMDSDDPAEQQQLGRSVTSFDRRHWENHRFQCVVAGNFAKFSQDETRKDALLRTENRIMAEASPSDRVWGIGFAASQTQAYDFESWGQNLLGRALMEVRERLQRT